MVDFIDPNVKMRTNPTTMHGNTHLPKEDVEELQQRLDYNLAYNYEKPKDYDRIIFVHLPKGAGNFLNYFFIWNKLPVDIIAHNKESNIVKRTEKNEKDFFFTVVRNPFDYWVSNFFYGKRYGNRGGFWGADLKRRLDNSDHKKEFNDFVDWVCERKIESDSLTSYYNEFLYDVKGKFAPNEVCRFENLRQDISRVFSKLGYKNIYENMEWFESRKGKVNSVKHKHYSEYYTPDSIEKVRQKEKTIIDKYGYEFNDK